MNLLDDFDFNFEEAIRHTHGGYSLEAAPVASRVYKKSSADQISGDPSHDKELQLDRPGFSDNQTMDPFEYLDDAALDEALQNTSAGLDHQNPSHEHNTSASQCTDGLVHNEDMNTLETFDDNEHYMSTMVDLAFDEAFYGEQDLKPLQIPRQSSTSSHVQVLLQQPSQDAELQISPQALSEALQYAYKNDLISDYLLKSLSLTHVLKPLVQRTIPAVNDDGFTDHGHLAEVEIPDPVVLNKFKTLATTLEALRLIAEARLIQSEEMVQSMTDKVRSANNFTHMKLELPILRTDNDRDMNAFQERYLSRSKALMRSIKDHRLPLHPQSLADGEGLEMSSKVQADCEMIEKKSKEEKIGVTKESVTYLFSLFKDEYITEDRMRHIIDGIEYKKISSIEKVTPPASPKLVPEQFASVFDPDQLPIHSYEPNSILSDNSHAIEDIMLRDYQDVWSASMSPLREFLKDSFTVAEPIFSERPENTLKDLKIEVPLVRDGKPHQSGPAEPNAFGAFFESQMDLDPEFKRAVLQDIPDDNLGGKLQDQLEYAAQNTLRSIEQEQLQVIDAVARVSVPVMDFLFAEPSWQHLCGKDQSDKRILKLIQAGNEELFKPHPVWPIDKASESKMLWSPLAPGVGKVPEQEYMNEGEPLLKRYLNLPPHDEVHKSLDCIRRRDKAIVFGNDDRDDEIEYQMRIKRPVVDLMKSGRKRSMDINSESTAKKSRRDVIHQTTCSQWSECAGPSLLPDDSSSASGNLLANFMKIHAPNKVLAHSRYFTPAQNEAASLLAKNLPFTMPDDAQGLDKPRVGFKAPCPIIEPPSASLTVFIDIRIPCRMIRILEGLIPDLTLLERDYDSHNTFVWKAGSVRSTEVKPTLADDADITISPSTGVIITSMIRIRQRPRAGTNKGVVQIRVEKASLRYERLIVLVGGDGDKDEVVDLMLSSDSAALLELQGFASGLESDVQVHYVGGGDTTLSHWVATFICRYGLVDQQILSALLETETLWEVFLRRAGFNVFAAQAVASQSKPPSDATDTRASAPCGLSAFMTMTRDERVRRFSHLVGARALDRVSRNVGQLWNRG